MPDLCIPPSSWLRLTDESPLGGKSTVQGGTAPLSKPPISVWIGYCVPEAENMML